MGISEAQAESVRNMFNEYSDRYEDQRDCRDLIQAVLNALDVEIEGVTDICCN